jgi:hypothetical protein
LQNNKSQIGARRQIRSPTQSSFFAEQRQEISFEVFDMPLFTEVIHSANSLPIEDCREARVLHQTTSFLDDPDPEAVPDLLQLRL